MRTFAALALCALAAASPLRVAASCSFKEFPSKSVQIEEGVSSSPLTRNRGVWHEDSLLVVARDGNKRSGYVRAASDQRFGLTDNVYEGGAYLGVSPHLILNAIGSFSPQHQTLPSSTTGGGADVRTGGGYGYQIQYTARTYTSLSANTTTLGADRYFADRRVALIISMATLSNVPGTAISEGLTYARYLPCDNESFNVSSGRDVENAGAGTLALYRTITYDANDVHWFTTRFGLDMGAGWSVLIGAYNRFEVRVALRERI